MIILEHLSCREVSRHIHPRGKYGILWLDVMIKGDRIRESLETSNKRDAIQRAMDLLRTRNLRLNGHMKLSELRQKVYAQNKTKCAHYGKWVDSAFKKLIETIGDRDIAKVTVSHVEKFRLSLHEIVKQLGTGGCVPISGKTINYYLECIRSGFNYAIYNHWITENPFSNFIRATEEEKGAHPYTPKLANAIVKEGRALGNDFDKVILIQLYTGMRAGDAVKLQFQDVRFEDSCLTLRSWNTKKKRERVIPLNHECMEVLEYMRQHYEKPVPFTISQLDRNFRTIREKLGFEGVLEDFRATCNTWLKNYAKLPDSLCEIILGHGHDNNVNSRFYTGLIPEPAREAMEVLSVKLHEADEEVSVESKPTRRVLPSEKSTQAMNVSLSQSPEVEHA